MFEHKRKAVAAFALAASFMMVLCAFAAAAPGSNATGEDLDKSKYGAVNEITIAPGYSWSYTLKFPADLVDSTSGLEVTDDVNDFKTSGYSSVVTIGEFSSEIDSEGKKSISVEITGITSDHAGKSYNVVLKAYHADSGQTKYQWIRIAVNQALSVEASEAVEKIINSDPFNLTLIATGGIGTVEWTLTQKPSWMSIGSTADGKAKISGTPDVIGDCKVIAKATCKISYDNGETWKTGQTKELPINFTVYSKLTNPSDETITAAPTVSSDAIVTPSDLKVTWDLESGTLPTGLTVETTGKITGTCTGAADEYSVVLKGTDSTTGQTATKNVTIKAEPAFEITGAGKVLTYTGNSTDKTLQLSQSATTSTVTWSIPDTTGIEIDGSTGLITVKGTADVTEGTEITVTAKTAYGQTKTEEVNVQVEDKLTFSGATKLVSYQSTSNSTEAYSIGGGSGNKVTITDYAGISDTALKYQNGKLTVSSAATIANKTVTLTAESAAGQEESITVDVQVFSLLEFNSVPSASGIFAVVNSST